MKGKYITLKPQKEIVQTWVLQSPTWPSGKLHACHFYRGFFFYMSSRSRSNLDYDPYPIYGDDQSGLLSCRCSAWHAGRNQTESGRILVSFIPYRTALGYRTHGTIPYLTVFMDSNPSGTFTLSRLLRSSPLRTSKINPD